MELVVTHREKIISKYQDSGWKALGSVIDNYLDTLNSVGIDADLFLLDKIDSSKGSDPKSIKASLRRLREQFSSNYLLFLGGPDIIPFYSRPDQTPHQILDQQILSDTYYVDFNENEEVHWPEMAVGRLPDGDMEISLLIDQLNRAAVMHRSGGASLEEHHAGFTADIWKNASRQTYFRIDETGESLKFCPPLGRKSSGSNGVTEIIDVNHFPKGGILFFNVHGHRQKPLWWGEQRIESIRQSPELVDYDLLSTVDLMNTIILSEACHAAAIHGRTPQDSLALCALRSGALAFVGCTTTCYAVSLPDGQPSGASGIDSLFQTMIYHMIKKRARFGDALREAKQFHIFFNAFDEKNILSLVLLGDPTLHFR